MKTKMYHTNWSLVRKMYALKKLIRGITIIKRSRLSEKQVLQNSKKIQNVLEEQHQWKRTKSVNIYESSFKEVSTHELIHDTLKTKEVHYPEEFIIENELVDLIIIPGVVFDEKCGRCGRGSGYYDKWLKEIKDKDITTIALAHDLQILPHGYELNSDEWDVPMNMIITEKRVITPKGMIFHG